MAVSKFSDSLPLYRQAQIYAGEGVELERSTLADWLGGVAHLVQPLVEALGRYVLGATELHADDTTVPVLAPGRGSTKTGRLWTYARDDRPAGSTDAPAVWFQYSPDRKGDRPLGHLKHFSGILQADGFGALYTIEAEMRGRPPEERKAARQARAGPLLDDLHDWLQATLGTVSKKSELALALRFAITRWTALTRYRDDGGIEIDNNAAERSLRAVAIGRKNYLIQSSWRGVYGCRFSPGPVWKCGLAP